MACLCTEIADSHTFLVLPLTTFRTTDGMNLAIDQVSQKTGFKMSHNTIGHALAYPIGNSSSHNLYNFNVTI